MIALARKEWLKLRPWLLLMLVAHLAFAVFFLMTMAQQFRVEHAEMIFYQANRIGRLFYADIRYVPLVTGAVLGVAQFLPEIIRARLRLSMHLPVSLQRLMLYYLAIGLIAVFAFLALDVIVLALGVGLFFPQAFTLSALATSAPWFLSGIAAYFGAALVLLEPDRRYQAVNLAIAGGVVALCHLSHQYDAYDKAIWGLVVLTLLMVPGIFRTAFRFRDGGTT